MEIHQKDQIVERLFIRFYREYPSLEKFGDNGKRRTKEDIYYHFQYLETAYTLRELNIFKDYVIWLGEVLETRGVGRHLLFINFAWLIEEIEKLEKTDEHDFYLETLKKGMQLLSEDDNLI